MSTNESRQEGADGAQAAKSALADYQDEKVRALEHILGCLDIVCFAIYTLVYLFDVHFVVIAVRCIIHTNFFLSIRAGADNFEARACILFAIGSFLAVSVWHCLDTGTSRLDQWTGYLHGGVIIDFIGQDSSYSILRVILLDFGVLVCQCVIIVGKAFLQQVKKDRADGTSSSGSMDNGTRLEEGTMGMDVYDFVIEIPLMKELRRLWHTSSFRENPDSTSQQSS